ncbi:MAG TPA: phosphotransferase family protein [Acidimicrobiales bacterium]|nr:phosphotransferase family protein [Acidimicrobiales bacterium]
MPDPDAVADPALAGALAEVLGERWGEPVEVEALGRLPGGSSRESWSCTVRRSDGSRRRVVLRRDPPAAPSSGLVLEADLLGAAADAGVPVPGLVTAAVAGGPLVSAYVIVDFVDGETIPRRVLRMVAESGTGDALAAQCGRVLAAVHTMAPASVPGLPGGDQLEQLRGLLDHLGQPHPAFELALRHAAANRPPRGPQVVVHGDFRTGNLLVGPDGSIRAVLDWELAHRGDPLEDLAWLCAKPWRFGSDLPVGGFGNLDALVSAYEEAAGVTVDRGALAWWELVETLRWGIICIVQVLTHTSGALRSVELAAIGRRVCEVEWDVLQMLG